MAAIKSKREFYRLWEHGCLGNRTEVFHTVAEAVASKSEWVGFREIRPAGAGAGEWTRVHHSERLLPLTHFAWTAMGRTFIMDGSAPHDHCVMQGEVCRTIRGLESYLAVGSGLPPMRQTMREGRHAHRGYLATKVLLDHYMDPSSHDDLDALLDLYPDATIELSAFTIDVGNIPGRNTIFWEVRDY